MYSINNRDLFEKLSMADKFNKANVFFGSQNKQKRSFSEKLPQRESGREIVSTLLKS